MLGWLRALWPRREPYTPPVLTPEERRKRLVVLRRHAQILRDIGASSRSMEIVESTIAELDREK